ncbi:MAG: large-conductance mechanosensitive channel protein MscL [Oscillospiraceae bacterium]|jgi:large conductance mechanosensitive channel|nr:large-conductance mechanosensitive channel protein MscL [Oscillospiraceae bacterium]
MKLSKSLPGKVAGEFKTFITRGNVVDLAVGMIVGAAFTAIVSSVVNDVITPLLGIFIGGVDLSHLTLTLPSVFGSDEPPVLRYGAFLQAIVNFLAVSVGLFFIVKTLNAFRKSAPEAKEPPKAPEIPPEVALLTEIRDLLKQRERE